MMRCGCGKEEDDWAIENLEALDSLENLDSLDPTLPLPKKKRKNFSPPYSPSIYRRIARFFDC